MRESRAAHPSPVWQLSATHIPIGNLSARCNAERFLNEKDERNARIQFTAAAMQDTALSHKLHHDSWTRPIRSMPGGFTCSRETSRLWSGPILGTV